MFKVIDAELCCFAKTDRAQVTGDLQTALVCFFYRRTQLITSNVHVSLVRRSALISPEVHHATSVVRPRELMHDRGESTATFQVRRRNVHFGTDQAAAIYQLLDFK